MPKEIKPRNVAVLLFDGVEVLDFAGPFEAFTSGSNQGNDFTVYTVAEQLKPVTAIGGLSVNPAYSFQNCPRTDVLVIPGGRGSRIQMNNTRLTDWVAAAAEEAELVLTVCTGALIAAKAIPLDGLTLTTHHSAFHELREVAPQSAKIVENVRFVDNEKIVLSAGVSAGIDMSLYVIGKLYGTERASETARRMEYNWNNE